LMQIVAGRAKKLTETTETVANGMLSGVVQFTGYFTGAVTNSKAAKKVFSLLPGEIALASLEGYRKICDAVEVAENNVLSTSSTVTTKLVSYKYVSSSISVHQWHRTCTHPRIDV
ncbi:hypothetical protein EJB05_13512, partial [Eragrostis curvula]